MIAGEREDDGRWLAEVIELPGVLAYGTTRQEAVERAQALSLRVLADRRPRKARFLILGSASPQIVKGVSESLAGRIRHVDAGGFELGDLPPARWPRLWLRGGFPGSASSLPGAMMLWTRISEGY